MPDPTNPTRTRWALPLFTAVATSAALGFGFLYVTRPNAAELGAIKVVVTDDDGKTGNRLTVVVAEAPFVQKETVSPGNSFTGPVQFPHPYRVPPHLQLIPTGKRLYDVVAVTEYGFTWLARPLPDDVREDARKNTETFDRIFGLGLTFGAGQGLLKSGLVFEDFSWEAKGVRLPTSTWPPKTYEQKGNFYTIVGQEAPVVFPVPYTSPPNVEVSGYRHSVVVVEITATGFKWKNVMKDKIGNEGEVNWAAKGMLRETGGK